MRRRGLLGRIWLIVGVILLAALTAGAGVHPLMRALGLIDAREVALIAGIQVAAACVCGAAWRTISGGGSLAAFALARWVRDGVSNLAGLVPATAEIMGARAIALLTGGAFREGAATTIADTLVEAMTQAAFTAIGIALIVGRMSGADQVRWLWLALLALAAALALFAVTRNQTLFRRLDQAANRLAARLTDGRMADLGVGERVRHLLAHPARLAGAALLHLLAWSCGGLQVYVAARAFAVHLSVTDCIALEALAHAGRSAFFFVPLGAGVQEGGFMLGGAALGLATPEALALSLVLRARDLAFGAPAILLWAMTELRTAQPRRTPLA
jgi:putative membrane protein